LLIDVGTKNSKELIHLINNLDAINEEYYNKLNKEADQVIQILK
jgi:hypothetical protein